jgi:SAM-dependent methyltransferase
MSFKDHFSNHAQSYAGSRPDYPGELYEWLVAQLDERHLCWDVATGNGQAASELAHYFSQVVATDASASQLRNALPADNISYRNEQAEHTSLEDNSVDLVTVAQALHWFEIDAFYDEVKRVLKPNGLIAVWTYGLTRINPAIDKWVQHLYADVLGAYWPSERRFIDVGYKSMPFPFTRLQAPDLLMQKQWDLDQFCAYLNTWSAVQRFIEAKSRNPVDELRPNLAKIWGSKQTVNWPLTVLLGRL